MKNMIMVVVSSVIGALMLAIVMTIAGRMNRSTEVQNDLPAVVENAMEEVIKETGSLRYAEDVEAFCLWRLVELMDTDSGIRLEIMANDVEKRILGVRFTEEYTHLNGRTGSVTAERAVIGEVAETEKEEVYEVKFYQNKVDMLQSQTAYKVYRVQAGEKIAPPAAPSQTGSQFGGWRDANDLGIDFTQPIEENLTCYAQWH